MSQADDKFSKLIKKAIAKHNSGKHAEAKSLYKKILSSNPQHLDANYLLGTLLAEQGDLSRALKQLKVAESIAPQSHLVKNNLGNVYRLQGDFQSASQCYEQALSLNPSMPEACNNLAIVYRRLGQDDLAMESFARAISLKPDFIEAIYNQGKCYSDRQQTEDAKACFQRALDIDSNYAPAHYELGVCEMPRGNKENSSQAMQHFRRYLALAPNDPLGARMNVAYLSGTDLPEKHPAELVCKIYEKKAASWDADVQASDKQFLGPQHIEKAITTYYRAATELQVLDIGCGTGLCGTFLRPMASRLVGVDLSPQMLSIAKQKNLYDELIESDIENYLVQSSTTFDLVTASGVLIFFGDLNAVLQKIRAVLKPNGRLIATLYHSEEGDVSIRQNIHFAHSEAHIRQVAKNNGFDHIALSPIVHEYESHQPQAGFLVTLSLNS